MKIKRILNRKKNINKEKTDSKTEDKEDIKQEIIKKESVDPNKTEKTITKKEWLEDSDSEDNNSVPILRSLNPIKKEYDNKTLMDHAKKIYEKKRIQLSLKK